MKLFATGCNGFVGSHFLNKGKYGFDIYCAVRKYVDYIDLTRQSILDLESPQGWAEALEGSDVVVHMAAIAHYKYTNEKQISEINTKSVIRFASEAVKAGVKRFVFVSSIGVNGTSTQAEPFTLDSEPSPHNDYARSKYDAEIGLKKIAKETGLEVVIVRPTLVYGPDAPGNFGMLTKLIKRLPVLPFGFATNRRDFISVQNLADLLVTCATHPNAAGHTFLASDGETVSIKEFTNAIAKGLDKKIFQLPVPVTLMRLAGKLTGKSAMIEQLYGNLEVDSSHIKEVLGWTPPFTMEQSMAFLKHTDK
ncbi:NAD-dependent epimerase/dehydratase family protein [Vibrio vulnificus]|uniref:NAD-dependent epimerase/dehydratase family protein n=1 Tax=Vibrio vulnificus TaxID=672 RepID=UPI0019D49C00|nr:NAD-dependent epimerase/dehydratase family protein [Vibrio vulnificus]MBN8143745.1 NAD-dependent epimerase/dehydratase family protein [Vibrio vulnificus]HAS6160760.1 NAD-dependent epimerase/dehydratase family protein [Vibrio vulnificus]HAS6219211.1 NAD-dependent epimerase/dehydratase family protein [Vibrio vulnificus]